MSRSAGLYGHRGPGGRAEYGLVPCTALLGEQAQQLLHFAHERRKALPRLATIGARFHHVAKGFYGPDSLPSMGKKDSGRKWTIGSCLPARSVQSHAHRGGGRFGGAMWPERSASSSRRSGRPSRRNGGDRADLGGRRGALPEPNNTTEGGEHGKRDEEWDSGHHAERGGRYGVLILSVGGRIYTMTA